MGVVLRCRRLVCFGGSTLGALWMASEGEARRVQVRLAYSAFVLLPAAPLLMILGSTALLLLPTARLTFLFVALSSPAWTRRAWMRSLLVATCLGFFLPSLLLLLYILCQLQHRTCQSSRRSLISCTSLTATPSNPVCSSPNTSETTFLPASPSLTRGISRLQQARRSSGLVLPVRGCLDVSPAPGDCSGTIGSWDGAGL